MVSIVLIDVVSHFSPGDDLHENLIDDVELILILRRWEELENFDSFDLEPWRRRSVIQIVCSIIMDPR